MERKKILFLIPSMNGGGAQKVISILLNHINKDKYLPILVLVKKEGEFLHSLQKDIKIIDLNSSKVRYSLFKIIKTSRTVKPDIIFSTLGHLNLALMLIRFFLPKNIKFIGGEHSIASIVNSAMKYPKLFDFLYENLYNGFDSIVCPSFYIKNDLIENYKINEPKIIVINNPVDFEKIENGLLNYKNVLPENRVNILAVGRLVKLKGFDVLIKAFSLIKNQSYLLTILGEGKENQSLKKLASELKIYNRVNFPGFKENPYPYMSQSNLLVLCSEYEGFPNVILEANACGTPALSFDSPGGISEIIINDENGYLLKSRDIKKLAYEITRLSQKKFNRKKMIQSAKEKYSAEKIFKEYADLFLRI